MSTNEQVPPPQQTNKHSIVSLILGIITFIIFCGGILFPFPGTSVICVPISSVIGFIALIYGIISLNRIKKHNQKGHPMAWTGILIGGFVFLCMICAIASLFALLHFAPETIRQFPLPPFIKNLQI